MLLRSPPRDGPLGHAVDVWTLIGHEERDNRPLGFLDMHQERAQRRFLSNSDNFDLVAVVQSTLRTEFLLDPGTNERQGLRQTGKIAAACLGQCCFAATATADGLRNDLH